IVEDGREPALDPDAGTSDEAPADAARSCYPDAWGGPVYATGDSTNAEDAAGERGAGQPSNSSSDGGCSIAARTATGGAGWLMALLAAGPLAALRRRR